MAPHPLWMCRSILIHHLEMHRTQMLLGPVLHHALEDGRVVCAGRIMRIAMAMVGMEMDTNLELRQWMLKKMGERGRGSRGGKIGHVYSGD